MRSADAEPPPADPPESAPSATDTDAPPKPTKMLRSERQAGVVVAAVLIGAVASSWAGDAFGGDSKAATNAAIGLGFIALLGAAVWYGHRIIGSIAGIMAGLAPMKPAFGFLPFASLAFGGYLMFRTSKAQKAAALTRPRRPPRERTKAGARSAKDSTADADVAVKRPTANRRYTPPKSKGATRRR